MNDEKKKEALEKQVQEKLAQVTKLLDECAKLAERGGFEFSWSIPGEAYYPSTFEPFTDENVMERLRENAGDEVAGYTPQQLKEAMDDLREEMLGEELPEYAELGSWWMPSRNC